MKTDPENLDLRTRHVYGSNMKLTRDLTLAFFYCSWGWSTRQEPRHVCVPRHALFG